MVDIESYNAETVSQDSDIESVIISHEPQNYIDIIDDSTAVVSYESQITSVENDNITIVVSNEKEISIIESNKGYDGGSGGNGLEVQEHSVVIDPTVNKLNFYLGNGLVTAAGNDKVNIFIPAPSPPIMSWVQPDIDRKQYKERALDQKAVVFLSVNAQSTISGVAITKVEFYKTDTNIGNLLGTSVDTSNPFTLTSEILSDKYIAQEHKIIAKAYDAYDLNNTIERIIIINPADPPQISLLKLLPRNSVNKLEVEDNLIMGEADTVLGDAVNEPNRTIQKVDFYVVEYNNAVPFDSTTLPVSALKYRTALGNFPNSLSIGNYNLRAVVTDVAGYSSQSQISIEVVEPPHPGIVWNNPASTWTNTEYVTSPLVTQVSVSIPAKSSTESSRTIASVQLWVEGSADGVKNGVYLDNNADDSGRYNVRIDSVLSTIRSPYNGAAVGSHTLKAKVTDSKGYNTTISLTINILRNPYAPHFNANDGQGTNHDNAVVPDASTMTGRRISNPNGAFNVGNWNDTDTNYKILLPSLNGVIVYDTNVSCSFENNSNNGFTIILFDGAYGSAKVSGFECSTTDIVDNGSYICGVNNSVVVNVSNWSADSDKYKARVNVAIDLKKTAKAAGGRWSVEIHHNNTGGVSNSKIQQDVFYEKETNAPTLSGLSLYDKLGNTDTDYKWISGVKYAKQNTLFTLEIVDIDNLNDQTIPYPVLINLDKISCWFLQIANCDLTQGNLYNYNTIWNNQDAKFGGDIPCPDSTYRGALQTPFKISARCVDTGVWVDSPNYRVITYDGSGGHGTVSESFNDDGGRLKEDYTAWPSSKQDLSGTQDLQIFNGRLAYPQGDYSQVLPKVTPKGADQVNYNSLSYTGIRWAYFRFTSSTGPQETGAFTFAGNITESDLNNSFKIFIRGNFKNVWLDLNQEAVNGFGFVFAANEPCRIEINDFNLNKPAKQLKYHLGMNGASDVLDIKIGFTNTSLYLDSFSLNFGA